MTTALSNNNKKRKRRGGTTSRSKAVDFTIDATTKNSILHTMIKMKKATAVILDAIEMYPNAVKHMNNENCYPLHYACKYNCPYKIVIRLYDLYKNAIREQDKIGFYPLHYACMYNQSARTVLKLIDEFPDAGPNNNGDFPVHIAFQYMQSERFVLTLIDKFPFAISRKNKDGYYPLQIAYTNEKFDHVVIMKLVHEFPQAVRTTDIAGQNLLHYLCRTDQSENRILRLIDKFPETVNVKDVLYYYPLHIALKYHQSEKVLWKLIEVFPQAATERNRGGLLPLFYACLHNNSDSFLLALITLNLMSVKHDLLSAAIAESSTITQVLEELKALSDYELHNRINIPKLVVINGLDNLRRTNTYNWVLHNSPIIIDDKYCQR